MATLDAQEDIQPPTAPVIHVHQDEIKEKDTEDLAKNLDAGILVIEREEDDHDQNRSKVYQTGWRLHALTAGLCVSLLLSTLETTIVSTSLVSIVNSLQGFDRSGWVVTSYLLTYTGFLIIFAKLSDIVGCKLLIMLSVSIFTIFSIACGFSSSMLSLIVLRAFQGLGGSGIYSLVSVMVPLMVPPAKYATYIAIISSVFAISSVLGPLLGGAITDNTTWRWVFYLNGPGGAIALFLLTVSVPLSFPYGENVRFLNTLVSERAWRRIDLFGAVSSLSASILLVFALQQGGLVYPWTSGAIISTFVLSGLLWIFFVLWQRWLSSLNGICEPMFPWRLAKNRFMLGLLLNAFLTGFTLMTSMINIPQRLQTTNGTTAEEAGIRLLPLLLCSPIATALAGLILTKIKLPPLYLLTMALILQTIGVGLFSSVDSSSLQVPAAQYGYQVIMGFGLGFNLSTLVMMVAVVVNQKDIAVAMGSVTQIRVLGGTIGLAISSAILNNHITAETSKILTRPQVEALLQSFQTIKLFPPDTQEEVRRIYGAGYSQQMRVMLYFCIVSFLSLALLVERRPRRMETTENGEIAERTA
ncbi:major facilitator superfamily transporter [Podospora appendiculata]|uniref:Major facilitator superfamily transporter n=1 Tax=Podospora appendiculata TaxID=314037 RepID=A0AAE0X857_9PEZI|nr:major facilitator superfamily transporter [Podospora appendiculata]